MKKPPEIVSGDKSIRLNFYLSLAIYILIIVSVESLIDFVLQFSVDSRDPQSILLMNHNKIEITKVVVATLYIAPLLLITWLGYRIITSAKLPPARMKLPFSVPLVQGKKAKLIGLFLMIFSLFFIFRALLVVST